MRLAMAMTTNPTAKEIIVAAIGPPIPRPSCELTLA
jgi:hypothetical protein